MALAMCLSLLPATALAANDLSGHWAEDVITQWQEKGYVSGYADGSFRPDAPITRAAFAKLMNRAVGFTEEAAISFADVAAGDWYYPEVARAVSAGYTQGYADGTFRPNKDITRAEAAAMIARATGLTAQESYADSFSDEVPAWARGSVGAVAAAGFMRGYADGTFGANATITRAAAVVTLDRVAQKVRETVTVTEPGTTLENQLIGGDLIVAESVGNGNVYLKNVTVLGDTYIRGGGSHSVYAENSRFGGTVHMQKNGLHMGISGTTEIGDMQMEKPSSITFEKGFSGSVKSLTIPEGAPDGKYSIEAEDKGSTPVENMKLDAKADLSIDANISSMTVGEKAENSTITVEKDATVDSMEVSSKVEVGGKGTVDNTEVSEGGSVTTPTAKPSGSSSSSSGGSSRPTVTFTPNYINLEQNARYASFKVDAAVTADDLKISVTEDGTVLEKDSDYTLTVSTHSNTNSATIAISFTSPLTLDATYQVTIQASSTGASKYRIEKTTTTLSTPKSVKWNAEATGTGAILPGVAIPEDGAKVTFTATGAIFNSFSTTSTTSLITATLKGSSSESTTTIDSSKITPTVNGNTVTVSLEGLELSADTYTLTLNVNKTCLEYTGNFLTSDPSTATATFTVNEAAVTLGNATSSPLTFTSGTALDTEGVKVSFPATGIQSIYTEGTNKATAAISPDGSGLNAGVSFADGNVVVTLSGEPTTAGTYTVTLNIPKDGITAKDGYIVPDGGFSKTFDFTVKPVSTTTPVTVGDPSVYSLIVFQGDDLNESPKTITFTTTGVKTMDASKVTVSMSEVSTITSSVSFTPPTSGATGTLTITFKGSVPADATVTGSGLTITIPTDAFTSYVDGYGAPDEYYPEQNLKLDVRSSSSSGD